MRRSGLFTLIFLVAIGTFFTWYAQGQQVKEIRFDLGHNIVETVNRSGGPKFSAQDTAGFIRYSVSGLLPEVYVHFTRADHELKVNSLYAFTLYADRDRDSKLGTQSATLQFEDNFSSQEQAHEFVRTIIEQFRKGRWKRHISESCPAVTGRSSIVDEKGIVNSRNFVCPDPEYVLKSEEWLILTNLGLIYRWESSDLYAELTINHMGERTNRPRFNMALELDVKAIKDQRDKENMLRIVTEGEAKGWGTAARHAAEAEFNQKRNRLLEQNALRRGDSVVSR